MNGDITRCSKSELQGLQTELEQRYADFKARNLKLNMARGKPAATQLELCADILNQPLHPITPSGTDARNYGVLDGLPEMRQLFGELLEIDPEQIIVGGNSSLNLMYDTVARLMLFGTGGEKPWSKLPQVKFLCPVPGYDRHFAVTEEFGIEMINVPMTPTGPDMDLVEKLVADPAVKGMWSVPLYSNPEGICYSDETVDRLAKMKCAAPDFRIFWDNAYGVHHLGEPVKLKNILDATREAGNPDRVYYFFSTSKITFPGAGVAMVATSVRNREEILKHMTIQTIGHDKLNQLRTLNFLKNAEGVREQMRRQAVKLRPKFEIVLNALEQELAGTGLADWHRPQGGYFVSVNVLDNCAKDVVALAKAAGVTLTGAGATFPYHRDPRDRNIRIAPTFPTEAELKMAIELFCLCVKLAGVRQLLTK